MQDNPWQRALAQLAKALEAAGAHAPLGRRLERPDRIIEVGVPVDMDSGERKIFRGYRVQHNDIRGPYKGGLRFHPQMDLDEAKALAFWMTMKNALIGVPFGGGKGGIEVDPKELSPGELERLTRAFARGLAHAIGPEKDVPAPDVGSTAAMMHWIADEYGKITGAPAPAVVTGKPVEHGGSEGRAEATGFGGGYVLEAYLRRIGRPAAGLRVAIQGFGNVGSYVAEYLAQRGFRIVALSDSRSGVFMPEGLDPDAAGRYKETHDSFAGFGAGTGGTDVAPDAVLSLPVDVVVPAALENAITRENAGAIRAPIVLELANGPTTLEADALLREKGIVVIPDILANAGGVAVSYFEWEQNRAGSRWSREDVLARLKRMMEQAAEKVFAESDAKGIPLRDAAYAVALASLARDAHAAGSR